MMQQPPHPFTFKRALIQSLVWIALALLFNVLIFVYFHWTNPAIAHEKALDFLTGYLLEKSLSIDNLLVFAAIFARFSFSLEIQRRILWYGVVGAVILRAAFIFLGIALLQKFHFVFYIFGAFLVWAAIMMIRKKSAEPSFPRLGRFLAQHFSPFWTALILIEISDIIFAIDSIPAIFAVTTDPFIVLSSNIFAILGLRALYFLMAHMMARFSALKMGIAIMLAFTGIKMLLAYWIVIPTGVLLVFIVAVLCVVLLKGEDAVR